MEITFKLTANEEFIESVAKRNGWTSHITVPVEMTDIENPETKGNVLAKTISAFLLQQYKEHQMHNRLPIFDMDIVVEVV